MVMRCLLYKTLFLVKIVAIVLAAGKGVRMKSEIPKPYIKINGKPVLAYALEPFQRCNEINEIIIAVSPGQEDQCKKKIVEAYNFSKVSHIIEGGNQRQDSIFNALKVLDSNIDMVLVHDGARFLVTETLLREGIVACKEHNAVIPVVPVQDTIKRVKNGYVKDTLHRENLVAVQTPQFFEYALLLRAYDNAQENSFYGTDDAMLVEKLGIQVKTIQGEIDNIKLTTTEDLENGKRIIEKREALA